MYDHTFVPEALAGSRKQFHGHVPDPSEVVPVLSLGEGTRLVSDRKIDFTHELATKILLMKELEGDRGIRNDNVTAILMAMQNGTFQMPFVNLITATIVSTGDDVRLNGQHTCWARLNMPEGWAAPKVRHLHYECQTPEDAKLLYASIDQGSIRTPQDKIRAILAGTGPFADSANIHILNLAAAGLKFHLWAKHHDRILHGSTDVAFLMQTKHLDLVARFVDLYQGVSRRLVTHMWRQPVAGAVYGTISKSFAAAKEFWSCVADGTGVTNGDTADPRLTLRNYLTTKALSAGQPGGRKAVTSETMYIGCLYAWNAFRKGEKLGIIRVPTGAKRPAIK